MKIQALCSFCGGPCVQTCSTCGQNLCAEHARTHRCGRTVSPSP